jgi:peptidoglycan/LPS O-acetylase OafA/YrhL
MGVIFILVGLGKLFHRPELKWQNPYFSSCVIPAMAFIAAGKYFYRRRYGMVQPRASTKRFGLGLLGIIGVFGLMYLDITLLPDVPISFTALGYSCIYLVIPFFEKGRRRYYWICGALLVAAALSPLLQIASKTDLFLFGWLNYLSLGVAILLGGLLDHRFLAHTLTQPSEA